MTSVFSDDQEDTLFTLRYLRAMLLSKASDGLFDIFARLAYADYEHCTSYRVYHPQNSENAGLFRFARSPDDDKTISLARALSIWTNSFSTAAASRSDNCLSCNSLFLPYPATKVFSVLGVCGRTLVYSMCSFTVSSR